MIIVCIIFGIAIGVMGMGFICRAKSAGTLIVVDSEGESPYLFIEISKPHELTNENYISVRVKRKKAAPQK